MKRGQKRLACRFCGDTIDRTKGDHLSWWNHNHPSACPYRTDRVPALNGVHVGDEWRNTHTQDVVRVQEIRLGGDGTYTDREPTLLLADVDADEAPPWRMPQPLWSLAEHYEPVTRPGELPVPVEPDERFPGCVSAVDEWRSPGYRHPEDPERDEGPHAYWHSFHTVIGYGIQWERTNELWQIDPDAAPTLLDAPTVARPREEVRAAAMIEEPRGQLALQF